MSRSTCITGGPTDADMFPVHVMKGRTQDTEVARLVGLGATQVADMNEWGYQWTVLQDPEGNEFCVAQTR